MPSVTSMLICSDGSGYAHRHGTISTVYDRWCLRALTGRPDVSVTSPSDVYYDPYDVEIDADPYPVYRRLREEAPLYYNDRHDFFAVSRAEDVEAVLTDHQRYISGRGAFLDFIRADVEMPPGLLIFEDPPAHTRHRKLLSRVFTPRRMAELEPQIRAYLRPQPGSPRRHGAVRLRRRPRGAGADAHDQHAPGHTRIGPGGRP